MQQGLITPRRKFISFKPFSAACTEWRGTVGCWGILMKSKTIGWSMFNYLPTLIYWRFLKEICLYHACHCFPPTHLRCSYLLCQEPGKKYGSKKTFAIIESCIYLSISWERYLVHLFWNKMLLNYGNLIGRQASLMLVCRKNQFCRYWWKLL